MSRFRQAERSAFVPGHGNDEGEPVTDSNNARMVFRGLTLILFCAMGLSPLEAQTFDWAKRAGGTGTDEGEGIAVDAFGNSFVTGLFSGTATFGPFTLTSAGNYDVFVAKYGSAGNVVWARSAGGTGTEIGYGIAIDAFGNSFVTGSFHGTPMFGPFTLTAVGAPADIFVAKYDSAGNVLWARSAGGTGLDTGLGIAVDGSGSSYVTGGFVGTATFGPFTLTSFGGTDIFVVKYDSGGNVVWATSGGATANNDKGYAIAVDGPGNSYATGRLAGSPSAFVAKWNSLGNLMWDDLMTGAGTGRAIAVDGSGNSYATGHFSGSATFGATTLASAGDTDVFGVKYNNAGGGQLLWAKSAGGTGADAGFGIAVDGSGNSYVTGYFAGTATFGTTNLTATPGTLGMFAAKYDSAGDVVWAKSAGTTGAVLGKGIAVDGSGNSYMTGTFIGSATFGATTLVSAGGGLDVFVAKLGDAAGGTCSSDSDGDGIQNGVDVAPNTYTDSFIDTSTAPSTTGSFANRGDQDLCASDEPLPKGVRVESLSGGLNPATVELICFGNPSDIEIQDLTSGECVICTCLSGPTAQVAFCPGSLASAGPAGPAAVALPVGAVELDLLRSGLVVATLVLPEGNSITYDPQTAEITAPASNNTTLNLVGRSGGQQPLAPGETTTVPDSAIPAVSVWGMVALTLALLVGAKIYFGRRWATQA